MSVHDQGLAGVINMEYSAQQEMGPGPLQSGSLAAIEGSRRPGVLDTYLVGEGGGNRYDTRVA